MNRDEAIRRAELFLSYLREEQQYQFCTGDDPDTWIDLHPYEGQETYLARFLDPFFQFRPKPKLLEVVMAVYHDGSFRAPGLRPPTETEIRLVEHHGGRWVRMREVEE